MKLQQIMSEQFTASFKKLLGQSLPVTTAYRLKATTALIDSEQTKFEEVRRTLVDKYAEKNEDGSIKKDEKGGYRVAEASINDYVKELNELLAVEIEVKPVKLAALGDKAELTVQDIAVLDGLITED